MEFLIYLIIFVGALALFAAIIGIRYLLNQRRTGKAM